MRPRSADYQLYYDRYIQLVKEEDALTALQHAFETFLTFIEKVPEKKGNYRYDPEKWTIKEVVQHLMDTERIMAYRALRFSRNDLTNLSGFDQETYIQEASMDNRSLESLIEEYKLVRANTLVLYEYFDQEMLGRSGVANDAYVTVNAIGYIIAGHELHHMRILKEKYLK